MAKFTEIELEMMIDQLKEGLEIQLRLIPMQSKILKEKYTSLLKEGFTEEQAMAIVKARPVMDMGNGSQE